MSKFTTLEQLRLLAARVHAEDEALAAKIEALAAEVEELEGAGYQTAGQVQTAIQTAISASGHAHFKQVAAVPAAGEAEANVLYLVMNEETRHYDIYALVGGSVVRIDDTTVDLSGYSTNEAMQAYVAQQITALDIGQYATDEELAALETAIASVYTKAEAEARFTDEAEAQAIAAAAVAAATASDEDVSAMLDEVFGS